MKITTDYTTTSFLFYKNIHISIRMLSQKIPSFFKYCIFNFSFENMGKIIQQSIRGSIWSYLGLVVGYINVGIIMPAFFMAEQIGLVQLFIALSNIFTNFSSLGFSNVINRMFPEFRDKAKNHHGFLFITVSVGLLGFVLSTITFFILKPSIVESNIEKSPLLVEYIILIIPIFFFRIFFKLLDTYNRVLHDAATGAFWKDFIHKALNLGLILLFAVNYITFREFFYGYIVSLCLPVIPLTIVLIKRGQFHLKPNLSYLNKPLISEMIIVSAFGLINGLSGVLTNNIDKLLINNYLSLKEVGIFSVCALFATVIRIPGRATTKISTGFIAKAWKKNDLSNIHNIYKKASLGQTIVGSLIFAGIIVNLNNIFSILPEHYNRGRWVLILYSIGILIRTSNTTSNAIIATSKSYRVLTLIITTQIIYTVLFHILLIPKMGITGAALAVLLTYTARTLIVISFIQYKFNMFCYSFKHLLTIIFASIAAFATILVPEPNILILNILTKSFLVSVLFISLILLFKVSTDFEILFKNGVKTLYHFVKKKES